VLSTSSILFPNHHRQQHQHQHHHHPKDDCGDLLVLIPPAHHDSRSHQYRNSNQVTETYLPCIESPSRCSAQPISFLTKFQKIQNNQQHDTKMKDSRTIHVVVGTWLFSFALLSSPPTLTSAFQPKYHPSRHAPSAVEVSPSFSFSSSNNHHRQRSGLSELNMASSNNDNINNSNDSAPSSSSSPPPLPKKPALLAEFEYQELKIQLNALQEQGILFSQLRSDKKNELEGYIRRIVNRRPSPIPLFELGQALTSRTNTSKQWKLVFSTQRATTESLPSDATVLLKFLNDKELEYSLKFGKRTMGLNRLTAKSTYTVDVSLFSGEPKKGERHTHSRLTHTFVSFFVLLKFPFSALLVSRWKTILFFRCTCVYVCFLCVW
jgi:hypothetical protein